jgi:hypothetical protein
MPQDNFKTDRAYFWSNSYVHPKAKSKFLVEFGSGIFNTNFNGKYEWLVKSANRPKYSAEYEDFKNSISYATTSVIPKVWNWEPITIKFVNPFSLTFWPRDLTQDLDEMLSNLAQGMIKRGTPRTAPAQPTAPRTTEQQDAAESEGAKFDASAVQRENESALSPIVKEYFGSSIKLHDVSMGFQSPKLGTGGDQDSNINGVTQYNDTNNPTIRPEELRLGKMYSNGYWELYNPWITKLDFGDFDYSVDEFIEISITFKYQNAIYFSKLREDQFGNDVSNQALKLPPSDKQRMKNIERDVAVARNSGVLQFLENPNNEATKLLNSPSPQFEGALTNPVPKSSYSTFFSNRSNSSIPLEYEADKIISDPKRAK